MRNITTLPSISNDENLEEEILNEMMMKPELKHEDTIDGIEEDLNKIGTDSLR